MVTDCLLDVAVDVEASSSEQRVGFRVLGDWDVESGGTTVARSRIETINEGCVIQENWMPMAGREGKSWNFFNTITSNGSRFG